ncbi:hypothetical protein JW758_01370 [Candidatus Peregrinibacteria bacterium]|nr:hypothetical protein [Candidatus Peregrinibacteria bacterium]
MKEKPFFVFALDPKMTKVAFGVTGEVARCSGAEKRTIVHVVDETVFNSLVSGSIKFSSDIGV